MHQSSESQGYSRFTFSSTLFRCASLPHMCDQSVQLLPGASSDRQTPLHMVAQEGYVKLACVLFEHGAYVTGQANDGQTPLHMALKEGHVEVVCILIKHGAEGIAETNNGWTPLLKRANKLTQQVCTWSIELLDIFLFFLFFSLYPQM